MTTERKYSPKTPFYYKFFDQTIESKANEYISGNNTRPLILYGAPGSGKSLFAEQLPYMVSRGNPSGVADIDPHRDVKQRTGLQLDAKGFEKLEASISTYPINERNYYFIVIDEVDEIPNAAGMNALKAFLDSAAKSPYKVVVVMTTNYPHKISKPVQDRCDMVRVELPRPEALFEFAKEIIWKEIGVTIDEVTLRAILAFNAKEGLSFREMYKRIDRIIAKLREDGAKS